jgi:meiotically up-regulated gene 157 (Mug157) protein
MTTRRELLKLSMLGGAAAMLGVGAEARAATPASAGAADGFVSKRPPVGERRFVSHAVDEAIARTRSAIADPELAWIFENCLPNTLDTTVHTGVVDGKPDTFVITGDIDAMWLRDSSAQTWPYLPFARGDSALRALFRGLIHRQARCILIDPYANAFNHDPSQRSQLTWAQADSTEMRNGVAERKWEVDSLCYPIRLAHGYWQATGDTEPFDSAWWHAMRTVLATFREQQRKDGPGPYSFQRAALQPTDTVPLSGFGNPTRPIGMIHSMFRPSDDACIYPLFVPANLFAVTSLRQLASMAGSIAHDTAFATQCSALADEVAAAVNAYGRMRSAEGDVWAYEVDGYGNQLFMDDANAPGLSSLAYLNCCDRDSAMFRRTAARAWSRANPYFFQGDAAEGIGGPHQGLRMIWPMSIIMHAFNSDDTAQIRLCLGWLKNTHAHTGFIHEAFDQDDPTHFTRPWFAWANALFGELILDLARRAPETLRSA